MSEELKPCPFCGSSDSISERADFGSDYRFCNNCAARGPIVDAENAYEEEDGDVVMEARTAAAWNQRSEPATARLDAPSPMSSAPKDGTPVLVRIKDDLSAYGVKIGDFGNTHAFCGLYAVMRCRDDIMGWSFAAPVGRGGFSGEWLDGWWPLPCTLAVEATPEPSEHNEHRARGGYTGGV